MRARARIRGRVQGVGFRATARMRAGALGIAGSVRNLPDGTVEAVFEGPRDRVESMLDWAARGPSGAAVDRVDVDWEPPAGETGFAAS